MANQNTRRCNSGATCGFSAPEDQEGRGWGELFCLISYAQYKIKPTASLEDSKLTLFPFCSNSFLKIPSLCDMQSPWGPLETAGGQEMASALRLKRMEETEEPPKRPQTPGGPGGGSIKPPPSAPPGPLPSNLRVFLSEMRSV